LAWGVLPSIEVKFAVIPVLSCEDIKFLLSVSIIITVQAIVAIKFLLPLYCAIY